MDTSNSAKQAVKASSGTMKGTVSAYRGIDNEFIETIEFNTEIVGRHGGKNGLTIGGDFVAPRRAQIYVNFVSELPTSNTYVFPNPAIRALAYVDGLAIPTYAARSGEVVFQNNDLPGQLNVNGKLEFTTVIRDGKYFKVEVTFAVKGIEDRPAPAFEQEQ